MLGELLSFLKSLTPNVNNTSGENNVDIDVDLQDINGDVEVNITKDQSTDQKAVISDDTILINTDQLNSSEKDQLWTLLRKVKSGTGHLARSDADRDRRAIESVSSGKVSDTTEFFHGLVSQRHHKIIKSSQYLREVADQPRSHIDLYRAKGDLADKFGSEAYYISNLVSSGYFDENRCLRKMYQNLAQREDNADEAFRSEFKTLVYEELLATFVSSDDSIYEVQTEVRSSLFGHFRHELQIEFLDVCGLGAACEQTIDTAINQLCEEYPELETERRDRGEERVERLYPRTIQDFEIA